MSCAICDVQESRRDSPWIGIGIGIGIGIYIRVFILLCFALLCFDLPAGGGMLTRGIVEQNRDIDKRNSRIKHNEIDLCNHAPTSAPDYRILQIIFAPHSPEPRVASSLSISTISLAEFINCILPCTISSFPPSFLVQPVAINSMIHTHARQMFNLRLSALSRNENWRLP